MSISQVKATVCGAEIVLLLQDDGSFKATATAPNSSSHNENGGFFPVSILATNSAGNSATIDSTDATFGQALRLVVKEKVKPVVTITSPTNGAFITSDEITVRFTATDDTIQTSGFSGIDTGATQVKLNGTAITPTISWSGTNGAKTGEFVVSSGFSDGENEISIVCFDFDGNKNDAQTATFTVDRTAPTLTITAPTKDIETNVGSFTLRGVTNDITSKPVTVSVTLGGADQGEVTVNADGTFEKALTLTEGDNVIVVTATDRAQNSTSVTRTIVFSTLAPVFDSVVITPNPADCGQTYIITVKVH